jgi:hypothetical protein
MKITIIIVGLLAIIGALVMLYLHWKAYRRLNVMTKMPNPCISSVLDFSRRNDSGKYLIRVAGRDDLVSDGVTAERTSFNSWEIKTKAEFDIKEELVFNLLELLDAENREVVGLRRLPYDISLFPGDMLISSFVMAATVTCGKVTVS